LKKRKAGERIKRSEKPVPPDAGLTSDRESASLEAAGGRPSGGTTIKNEAGGDVPSPPTRPTPSTVGIGASAGGLEAFQRLLQRLPSKTGMAYVIVQHLDPEHESLLPELLAKTSAIPVVQAFDGIAIVVDHAYVIPPNTTMTITDGHLRLVAREKGRGLHLPIDAFLSSLAAVHGSSAVGVILSGAGSDGSRGIEAIKEAGGITIAQDSVSAQVSGMPESAIDTGAVDFVLAPEEIADQLARLGSHLTRNPDDATTTTDSPSGDEGGALRKILGLLYNRTGVDFQHYRSGTLHRRILRRMLVHRQDTRSDYLAHVRLDPAELDLLYEELLIPVTRFFRDQDVFATLRDLAFPAMMEGRTLDTPVRVWVPGCASGEEAYSLAIALLEFFDDAVEGMPIQIFGTDLSEVSIAKARAALYPETITSNVSADRLRRYFVHEAGGYRITKAVRDLCIFSRQNVVRDPPFSHLDLISCRNVFIYLEPQLQQRVFPIFHYALESNGLLLLGTAESASSASEYFEPLDKPHRIYRRRATAVRPLDVDFTTPKSVPSIGSARRIGSQRAPTMALSADEVVEEADRLVFAQFTPPGVVINERMEILHFRGDTAGFLALTPGMASLDLLKLARPELIMPLHAAIREAGGTGQRVRGDGIVLIDGDVVRHIAIEVHPFHPRSASARFLVVVFAEQGPPVPIAKAGGHGGASKGRRRQAQVDLEALDALRQEIAATKRYLHDVVEQHEATAEELRAASEELESSNEELQSTNEELETTKEEVQSTNEELTTLNEELRHRNRELADLSGDLANVLASTTIPIVIVGADLKLRRFTPATARVMRVIASDAGRPLGDIKLRIILPNLERDITSVIQTLTVVEREVRDEDGRWWSLTIRPYQTIDRRVDGAVLVFADIDATKRYGERANEVSEARRQLLDAAEAGRLMANEARAIAETANQAKGTFLASMSHDLRTPLNAITGYTELLEQGLRGPVTNEQMNDLGRIKRNARYLLALLNDILNFAKVEAGHLDVSLTDVPIGALLAELHDLVAPQLMTQSLHFDRSACGDVTVHADPEKLRQILLNLLSNAFKFTASDGQIGIDCVTEDAIVRIEVWDTGRGIASEQIENIFQPFVQIDRGLTSAPPGGVGLGLAISRALARAMNGDLTVDSTLGKGSRFVLTLPRKSP
jgi:two-component system CheB/CheR fusion protein